MKPTEDPAPVPFLPSADDLRTAADRADLLAEAANTWNIVRAAALDDQKPEVYSKVCVAFWSLDSAMEDMSRDLPEGCRATDAALQGSRPVDQALTSIACTLKALAPFVGFDSQDECMKPDLMGHHMASGIPGMTITALTDAAQRLRQLANWQPVCKPGAPISKRTGASKEAIALGVLADHPDWSDIEIAKSAGCNRTSLYAFPKFMAAKKILRRGKDALTRGSKYQDGGLEAWDNEDDG